MQNATILGWSRDSMSFDIYSRHDRQTVYKCAVMWRRRKTDLASLGFGHVDLSRQVLVLRDPGVELLRGLRGFFRRVLKRHKQINATEKVFPHTQKLWTLNAACNPNYLNKGEPQTVQAPNTERTLEGRHSHAVRTTTLLCTFLAKKHEACVALRGAHALVCPIPCGPFRRPPWPAFSAPPHRSARELNPPYSPDPAGRFPVPEQQKRRFWMNVTRRAERISECNSTWNTCPVPIYKNV